MAKRRGNKSAAIRQYISAHPSATVKDIQAALATKRMKASNALIAKVRSGARSKPKAMVNGKSSLFGNLLLAKAFVNKAGGVAAAKEALQQFATLIDA